MPLTAGARSGTSLTVGCCGFSNLHVGHQGCCTKYLVFHEVKLYSRRSHLLAVQRYSEPLVIYSLFHLTDQVQVSANLEPAEQEDEQSRPRSVIHELGTLRARVSLLALCSAYMPVLQANHSSV